MAKTLLPNQCDLLHQYYPSNDCCLCRAEALIRELEEQIKKLGKLPDKPPPLLSDEEMWIASHGETIGKELAWRAKEDGSPPTLGYLSSANGKAIAQAQREADIKHYEGEE